MEAERKVGDKKRRAEALRNKDNLLVYTMGKVASSTVSASIVESGLECLDVHSITPDRIMFLIKSFFDSPDFNIIPPHLISGIRAYNACQKADTIKIVSLLREPISRNISAVFQNLPQKYQEDPEEILRRLKQYSTLIPDTWFRTDFFPATGIDVFSEKFSPHSDSFLFKKGKFEVVFVKSETPDSRKETIISDFIGEPIKLKRVNEATQKWYVDIYKIFKDNPHTVSDTYLQECFDLDYYKKFYSNTERQRTAKKFGFNLKV